MINNTSLNIGIYFALRDKVLKVKIVGKHIDAAAAKSLQSCLTLWDPMDCSPPGSSVHRILQARILEWVALLSFRVSSWYRDWTCISYASCCCWWQVLKCVWLFVTPWTVAHQAPLSTEFSRQEYWSGLPRSPLGDLPDPGMAPWSPALQADSLPSEPPGKPL